MTVKLWKFNKETIHDLMKRKEVLVLPTYNYVYDITLKAEIIANGNEIKVRTTYKSSKEKFIEFLRTLRERYKLPKGIQIRVQTISEEKLKDLEEFYKLRIKSKMPIYYEYLSGKIDIKEFSKYLK